MRILLSSLFILGLVGCASSSVTNKQVTTLQILQRVNELQDTVTELYAAGAIAPAHALVYSKFVVSATNTVKTLPDGWQTIIKSAWTQLKLQVPFSDMEPKVQVTARLIDAMLSVL